MNETTMAKRILAAGFLAATMLVAGLDATLPAHASTIFTVNSDADAPDSTPGNGVCDTDIASGVALAHGQGTLVSVRGASPSDREALRRMFSRSSAETIRRRFHIPYPRVPDRMLDLMLDQGLNQFLLAVADLEVVGHAMYAWLGQGDAEMAIIVEDGWQSKGIGKMLLRELADGARLRGVQTFVGTVLPENHRMLGLIDKVFPGSKRRFSEGAFEFRAPLWEIQPPAPARTLRTAA